MMLWFIFTCSEEFTGPMVEEVGELLPDDEVNRCTELFRAVACNLGCTLESPRGI